MQRTSEVASTVVPKQNQTIRSHSADLVLISVLLDIYIKNHIYCKQHVLTKMTQLKNI